MQANRLIYRDGQEGIRVIPEPSLEAVRARLLEVIRQRPVPKPAPKEPTLLDVTEWQRRSRSVRAQQVLRSIPDTTSIATAIGVTPRCVAYWRRGQHSPTLKHFRQLRALRALMLHSNCN